MGKCTTGVFILIAVVGIGLVWSGVQGLADSDPVVTVFTSVNSGIMDKAQSVKSLLNPDDGINVNSILQDLKTVEYKIGNFSDTVRKHMNDQVDEHRMKALGFISAPIIPLLIGFLFVLTSYRLCGTGCLQLFLTPVFILLSVVVVAFMLLNMGLKDVCKEVRKESQGESSSLIKTLINEAIDRTPDALVKIQSEIEGAEQSSASTACMYLRADCDEYAQSNSRPYYCDVRLQQRLARCANMSDVESILDQYKPKPSADPCGYSHPKCSIKNCATYCLDQQAKTNAKEFVIAWDKLTRISQAVDDILMPMTTCPGLFQAVGAGPVNTLCIHVTSNVSKITWGYCVLFSAYLLTIMLNVGASRIYRRGVHSQYVILDTTDPGTLQTYPPPPTAAQYPQAAYAAYTYAQQDAGVPYVGIPVALPQQDDQ
jgi:hypothetical protein